MTYRITSLFPWILLVCGAISFAYPSVFSWFKGDLITYSLGFIMLGMGITLTPDDFTRVFQFPIPVMIGFILQYSIMPFGAYMIAKLMDLPDPLATGIILVGACPGGTASNVITYIAKANVALSVTMTTFSTIAAVAFTPFLTSVLAGNRLEVNTAGLLVNTLQVVILPVLLGVFINFFLPNVSKKLQSISPVAAVVLITMIVSSVIAGEARGYLISYGFDFVKSVFLLHIVGFFLGYWFSHNILKDPIVSRTISIEVGMQNSGLAVVLAKNNFTDPIVAVPGAISALVHSLIGSALAAYWNWKSKPPN